MTYAQIKGIVDDYCDGKGLTNMQLAKKYNVSNTTIRTVLIKEGVYKPQRVFYNNPNKSASIELKWAHAKQLLNKVIQRHEAGLLPDRFIYEEIKNFLSSHDNTH